jgi:uncharacterized damage-inducible protein DinB
MSALEQIQALYDYNEWANNHVLAVASTLSEEEFSRDQGASWGSVEANLAHINAGHVVWLARWKTGRNPGPLMEVQSIIGYETIRKAFEESHEGLRDYVRSLREEDLERVLHYQDSRGTSQSRVLWQLLLHLVNHGTHHRAEVCMALMALGKAPRELDYHYFELERA